MFEDLRKIFEDLCHLEKQFNKIKVNNEAINRVNDKNHLNNSNTNTPNTQKNGINEKRKQTNDVETSSSAGNPTEQTLVEVIISQLIVS